MLFEEPTIERMAIKIEMQRKSAPADDVPPIEPASRILPIPLSFAQQRLWFLAQLDAATADAYHVTFGLRLQGHLILPERCKRPWIISLAGMSACAPLSCR